MIFSKNERTDASPKQANEDDFSFLDRSADPVIEVVRNRLEEALTLYPSGEIDELIQRIKCGEKHQFDSATFELFLYEFLVHLGMKATPHPELPNGSDKRPDFLVECPDGSKLYVEAKCSSEDWGRSAAAEARKATALQHLDNAAHSNFLVAIASNGDPKSTPSGKKLAADVHAWLDTLDPDAVQAGVHAHGVGAYPKMVWEFEDWHLEITASPLRPESRGQARRLFGMFSAGAAWVDGVNPIRRSITKKSGRYGELELPLVIAISLDVLNIDHTSIEQALFGDELIVLDPEKPEAEPQLQRDTNGVWQGVSGSQGERTSGVWFFNNLNPYRLGSIHSTLYLHPSPKIEVPRSFLIAPHAYIDKDSLIRVDGLDVPQVLGLDKNWP